ncbi:MAG TPA: E3 binding domain-containing protein, partial [Solirubrobacteraceae bacterium]|nr:E3 binding domain-containing protein [Solirubrobacteraceae bacterium]
MSEIVMPRLSDSMEEGTILKWLKADGDAVARGEPLAEIETDKATLTYESDADGVLTIVAAAGDTLPIGSVIARLDDGAGNGAAAPAAQPEPEPAPPEPQPAAASQPPPSAQPTAAPAPAAPAEGRVKASPLARRIAREQDIDLRQIAGSGPGGRIVRADVEHAAQAPPPPPAPAQAAPTPAPAAEAPAPAPPAPAPSETGTAKGDVTLQELTRTQQLIARRMAESKATVPEFTLRSEIDMEACVALRAEIQVLGGDGAGGVPSFNDMVVKACALALREFPRANG